MRLIFNACRSAVISGHEVLALLHLLVREVHEVLVLLHLLVHEVREVLVPLPLLVHVVRPLVLCRTFHVPSLVRRLVLCRTFRVPSLVRPSVLCRTFRDPSLVRPLDLCRTFRGPSWGRGDRSGPLHRRGQVDDLRDLFRVVHHVVAARLRDVDRARGRLLLHWCVGRLRLLQR